MDKHIEMTYCSLEAFRSLTKMYLDVDVHMLFDTVRELLWEVEIMTFDVAEHLTPKSSGQDPNSCVAALVKALEATGMKKANNGNDMTYKTMNSSE